MRARRLQRSARSCERCWRPGALTGRIYSQQSWPRPQRRMKLAASSSHAPLIGINELQFYFRRASGATGGVVYKPTKTSCRNMKQEPCSARLPPQLAGKGKKKKQAGLNSTTRTVISSVHCLQLVLFSSVSRKHGGYSKPREISDLRSSFSEVFVIRVQELQCLLWPQVLIFPDYEGLVADRLFLLSLAINLPRYRLIRF